MIWQNKSKHKKTNKKVLTKQYSIAIIKKQNALCFLKYHEKDEEEYEKTGIFVVSKQQHGIA